MNLSTLLARQLADTRDWTNKLLADLKGEEWTFQPKPGLGHVLWMCGHLTSSQNTLVHERCLGQSVLDDSFKRHFPIGGAVLSACEYDYPPVGEVLRQMEEVYTQTCEAVRGMSDELLAEPAYGADGETLHPHYRDKAGAVSHCNRHEAFHAGQIAMIRRLLGKPFLR